MPMRDSVQRRSSWKYRQPRTPAIAAQSTSSNACPTPPAPAPSTTAASTNSITETIAKKPPLSASDSSASDSITRPSNWPAP